MERDDAEEYTQALGQVVAGGWRQIALGERLGVPDALGMTTREWVDRRLGGYVRLSIPERRDAVQELVAEGMSQRQAGDVLGVDQRTVGRDLEASSSENGTDPAFADESTASSEANSSELIEQRISQLDDELAARVRAETLPLDEAEVIAAENRARVVAWVKEIRAALTTLTRMVGHPVPDGLAEHLSMEERRTLTETLAALATSKGE